MHRSGVGLSGWENKADARSASSRSWQTAREHDQPYEWSLHEMEAIAVGLDPAVIDIVRTPEAAGGIGDKETTIIELAREIARTGDAETYSRALTTFGETPLVDVVSLMGGYAATATRLVGRESAAASRMETVSSAAVHAAVRHSPGLASRLPLIRTPRRRLHAARAVSAGDGARRHRTGTDRAARRAG
jgi:hypothetical protein